MTTFDRFLLAWFGLTSLLAFLLFSYDKFRAGRPGSRVPEFQLVLVGALGGWLGGFALFIREILRRAFLGLLHPETPGVR